MPPSADDPGIPRPAHATRPNNRFRQGPAAPSPPPPAEPAWRPPSRRPAASPRTPDQSRRDGVVPDHPDHRTDPACDCPGGMLLIQNLRNADIGDRTEATHHNEQQQATPQSGPSQPLVAVSNRVVELEIKHHRNHR